MNTITCCYPFFNPAEYEAIWFGKTLLNSNKAGYESLRKNTPDCKVLRYMSSCTTIKPEAVDPLAYEDYYDFNSIRPEWFLLKDITKPSQEDNWLNYPSETKRFFLDMTSETFQQYAIDSIIKRVEIDRLHPEYNFSGVAFDNVLLGQFVKDLFGGSNWKYKGKEAQWDTGFMAFMTKLKNVCRDKGYLFVINPTLVVSGDDAVWQGLDCADMILMEYAMSNISVEQVRAIKRRIRESKLPIWFYGHGSTYQDFLICEGVGSYAYWRGFRSPESNQAIEKTFYE